METINLDSFPNTICELEQLMILHIKYETKIDNIPHCISKLNQLIAIWMDSVVLLSDIPLSLFNLPNLIELSLYNGQINYFDLLEYNNITNVYNINDTEGIQQWFDDYLDFERAKSIDYWLQLNPICDEYDLLPTQLNYIMDISCDHPCIDTTSLDYQQLCTPRIVGDGKCDTACQLKNCGWDNGDCIQLCFAPELTNCSLDKIINDKCDDECNNNTYCSIYPVGSNFVGNSLRETADVNCFSDSICDENQGNENINCSQSVSIYIDPNLPSDSYYKCPNCWNGNGLCDDSCRTDECGNDSGDCDEGKMCGYLCQQQFDAWNSFFGKGVYKANHSYACDIVWSQAVITFKLENPPNCTQFIKARDYNNDGFINFREFIVIASVFLDSDEKQWSQINCSECIGIQYYNL